MDKVILVVDRVLSIFKYILAGSMMVNGVATVLAPLTPVAKLGFIYSNHFTLAILGVYIFVSGAVLLYGKIRKNRHLIGVGLMMIYLIYVFATCVQYIAGLDWIVNLIMSAIVGALYLRWRYRKFYATPTDIPRHKRHTKRLAAP